MTLSYVETCYLHLGMRRAMSIYSTLLAACSIHAKPSCQSKLVTQLLFGERVKVIRRDKGSWALIQCLNDGSEGWINWHQLILIKQEHQSVSICLDLIGTVFSDHRTTLLTMGAELYDFDGMTGKINQEKFRFSGQAIDRDMASPQSDFIARIGRKLLNVPYMYGGRTPLGIDASGFTQLVFKCCGINLSRTSKQQSEEGQVVDFISTAQPGDLAFFNTHTEDIDHVGILIGEGKIIHAFGQVRIDKVDHYGIFNALSEQYSHRLKIIKRMTKSIKLAIP